MSKGNLFLGQARGKVGDVVFYRLEGEQVTRSRNRSPRNPRAPMQLAQRVIMNTVSKAYSLFQELADHAFEGLSPGAANQRQFIKDNNDMLRIKCAAMFADPEDWRYYALQVFNFNQKPYTFPVLNDYYISRGTVPSLVCECFQPLPSLSLMGTFASDDLTYQQVCDGLGLLPGDQITFVVATHDGRLGRDIGTQLNGIKFARVILEPSNGDMSAAFLSGGAVNLPNLKNEGDVVLAIRSHTWADETTHYGLDFSFADVSTTDTDQLTYGGAAAITSRWSGTKWLRSTQQLVPCWSGNKALNYDIMLDAIDSYMTESGSDLYLNQSDAQGVLPSGQAVVVSATLYRAGSSLDVMSRGGVYNTASSAHSVFFIGGGFDNDSLRASKDGEELAAASMASDSARFSLEGEGTFNFYVNGEVWCTVVQGS